MVKVNAEVDTATAARYRVRVYPTILVLQKDGTEVDRIVGYLRAPGFIQQAEDYLAGKGTLAMMVAEEKTRGSDPRFVSELADKYFGHGLTDEARVTYLRLIEIDPKNGTGQVDDALYTLARMSRKQKDYAGDRKYAQRILDRYPDSDMAHPAILEIAGAWRREGDLKKARDLYLDYAKRYPQDEDAPWAKEQADTLSVRMRHAAS
ncbi:MAG TPA: tetratricopeptide repeat protein [Candidatus Eisenbacteria bacterium]